MQILDLFLSHSISGLSPVLYLITIFGAMRLVSTQMPAGIRTGLRNVTHGQPCGSFLLRSSTDTKIFLACASFLAHALSSFYLMNLITILNRKCPICRSTHVRPSASRMPGDRWRRLFLLAPWRCDDCECRFSSPRRFGRRSTNLSITPKLVGPGRF